LTHNKRVTSSAGPNWECSAAASPSYIQWLTKNGYNTITQQYSTDSMVYNILFHRSTHASYVYNVCLAWIT